MKSLIWTGPRQLVMQTCDDPVLEAGEVLLKVSKVGICGSELSGYLGKNSLRIPPLIMGHEFSATIMEQADDVTGWTPGQLVTVNPLLSCRQCNYCLQGRRQLCRSKAIIGIHRPGAFAEYVAVPATACYAVEDELQGALVEPLACAVRANMQAQTRLDDTVLVFGAGIIGLMSLRVAQAMGAPRRIIVDTNATRLEKALSWGATETLNPLHTNVVDEIKRLYLDGVDNVIDAVGVPQTRQDSIAVVKPGGRVVFIGLHLDETSIPGNTIVRQEITITGSFCYSDKDFLQALHMLQRQEIIPDVSWLDIRPLEAGKQAFDEQIEGPASFPKIILRVE